MTSSSSNIDTVRDANEILSKWGCTSDQKTILLAHDYLTDKYSNQVALETNISSETLERALCIISIDTNLAINFSQDDSINNWVNQENSHPVFSGKTAMDFMLEGPAENLKKVAALLASWSVGNY